MVALKGDVGDSNKGSKKFVFLATLTQTKASVTLSWGRGGREQVKLKHHRASRHYGDLVDFPE